MTATPRSCGWFAGREEGLLSVSLGPVCCAGSNYLLPPSNTKHLRGSNSTVLEGKGKIAAEEAAAIVAKVCCQAAQRVCTLVLWSARILLSCLQLSSAPLPQHFPPTPLSADAGGCRPRRARGVGAQVALHPPLSLLASFFPQSSAARRPCLTSGRVVARRAIAVHIEPFSIFLNSD